MTNSIFKRKNKKQRERREKELVKAVNMFKIFLVELLVFQRSWSRDVFLSLGSFLLFVISQHSLLIVLSLLFFPFTVFSLCTLSCWPSSLKLSQHHLFWGDKDNRKVQSMWYWVIIKCLKKIEDKQMVHVDFPYFYFSPCSLF